MTFAWRSVSARPSCAARLPVRARGFDQGVQPQFRSVGPAVCGRHVRHRRALASARSASGGALAATLSLRHRRQSDRLPGHPLLAGDGAHLYRQSSLQLRRNLGYTLYAPPLVPVLLVVEAADSGIAARSSASRDDHGAEALPSPRRRELLAYPLPVRGRRAARCSAGSSTIGYTEKLFRAGCFALVAMAVLGDFAARLEPSSARCGSSVCRLRPTTPCPLLTRHRSLILSTPRGSPISSTDRISCWRRASPWRRSRVVSRRPLAAGVAGRSPHERRRQRACHALLTSNLGGSSPSTRSSSTLPVRCWLIGAQRRRRHVLNAIVRFVPSKPVRLLFRRHSEASASRAPSGIGARSGRPPFPS